MLELMVELILVQKRNCEDVVRQLPLTISRSRSIKCTLERIALILLGFTEQI